MIGTLKPWSMEYMYWTTYFVYWCAGNEHENDDKILHTLTLSPCGQIDTVGLFICSAKNTLTYSVTSKHIINFSLWMSCVCVRVFVIVHCTDNFSSLSGYGFDSIRFDSGFGSCSWSCLSTRRYITIIPFCQWQFYTIRSRETCSFLCHRITCFICVCACAVYSVWHAFSIPFHSFCKRVCDKRQACTRAKSKSIGSTTMWFKICVKSLHDIRISAVGVGFGFLSFRWTGGACCEVYYCLDNVTSP